MTQPNNLSKVWRCERCSRCREGDFAHCKNTKYRIESATPAAIDSSPVYSKSIDDVPAAINPQPVWILPAAWLHYVAQDDGTQDQALSFSRDSFPLQGVGGFHSTKALPLFLAAPTPAEIMLAYENMIEERATLARQLAEAKESLAIAPKLAAEDSMAEQRKRVQAEAQLAQATARLAAVDGWIDDGDTIPKSIINECRDAICLEFGNNGTDGYYKRILVKVFAAALQPQEPQL